MLPYNYEKGFHSPAHDIKFSSNNTFDVFVSHAFIRTMADISYTLQKFCPVTSNKLSNEELSRKLNKNLKLKTITQKLLKVVKNN